MSRLGGLADRVGDWREARARKQPPKDAEQPTPHTGDADLRKQRDRLLEKFTIMQTDLGGAFYEMAIRDHVRIDVLTAKAAELQQVDSELLALERLLELDRHDAAGLCSGCGAPYGHADRFCPQCGTALVPREAVQ